jgi:hypothetical protein
MPEADAEMVLYVGHERGLVLTVQHVCNGGSHRAAHGRSAVDHAAGRTSTDATLAGSGQAARLTSQAKVVVVAPKGVSSQEDEHALMVSRRVSFSSQATFMAKFSAAVRAANRKCGKTFVQICLPNKMFCC